MVRREKKEGKEIIFCQGDKKELEEITGEEYEYITSFNRTGAFKDVIDHPRKRPLYKKVLRTYLEGHGEDEEIAKGNLYSEAIQVKADAIIHYNFSKSWEIKDTGSPRVYPYRYLACGTPVRKKK